MGFFESLHEFFYGVFVAVHLLDASDVIGVDQFPEYLKFASL